ncbi:FecR family protein [Dinghuibacter silviterrae]|nr:FecR domain-containing protein [Dinghuibacter silviterrae]
MPNFEGTEGPSLEDLLADESFLAWYRRSDATAFQRWQHELERDPARKAVADQAIVLLQQLDVKEVAIPEGQVSAAENKLFARIAGMPQGSGVPESEAAAGSGAPAEAAHSLAGTAVAAQEIPAPAHVGPTRVIRLRSWRTWVSAAACVLVVALAAWLDKNWISGKKTLDTPYGQIASVVLPDGTEATLNAHSSLTWRRKMREGEDREVWLKGEAYLHVAKKPEHERFIVHTDHFDVIVTGTHFNVSSVEAGDGVVLQEGSVTVRTAKGEEAKLQPGDQVQYRDGQLVRQTVNPDNVIAWTNLRVVFDNATLEDVLTMIRQHYGVKVRLDNPALLHSPVNGMLANDNLDVLFKALALANNLTIQKDGDQYVIR